VNPISASTAWRDFSLDTQPPTGNTLIGKKKLLTPPIPKEERRDMKTFADKIYDKLRKVPKGRVTTYKELAHALKTKAYRGVGQAMKRNPYAPEVP
jgi:O6-methylguanine-DNA--protein-cysteine methyltransferase